MSTAVLTTERLNSIADTALRAAARFWFVVAALGQLMFVVYIVSFYGRSVVVADFTRWNTVLFNGYVLGDHIGNLALGIHILLAAVVTLGGLLQLIPQIRNRFPTFHRWTGRIYILTAFTTSIAGLYLLWIRGGTVGDTGQHLVNSMNAVLIMICAGMTVRYAMARDLKTHRVWALRLFLVVSGSWFFRVALMLSFLIFKGPVGFDPVTFQGPFLTFLVFAESLFPLAVLELYLRAKDLPAATYRIATAAILLFLTLGMGGGIVGATMGMWMPSVKSAIDGRKSIIGTLEATIASHGIDAAVTQYHGLKAASPSTYNFDEDQLNALGYHLLHHSKIKEGIRILQLNVESYPQSGDAYDSLAEAYFDDANKPQAIANYKKSLELNAKNGNGVLMLKKLDVQ
jgi:hypothetical protein